MNLFKILKAMRAKKITNYKKEEYRGTIKQIMKVRGLRTISLANYNEWAGLGNDYENGVHSFKINIQDGYVNAYGFGTTKKGKHVCSTEAIQDATADFYKKAYDNVMAIITNEDKIPAKVRRNILVPVSR